jgi:predicted MPP superfamily phosphohydrolase
VNWRTAAARRVAGRLERAPGSGDVRILLGHRPDAVLDLRERTRVDLVVAGHTHGGQVVVPGFGPPITKSGVPRDVAAGGLHELSGRRVYVSRGIGVEHGSHAPHLRINCPPELTLLRLRG